MSNRELVIDVVNMLPENTPLKDIIRELAYIDGINEALAQSEAGQVVSIEEARQRLKTWTQKSS
jgi:predicted transcriptional regulator